MFKVVFAAALVGAAGDAAASGSGDDIWGYVLNYGILGVMFVLVVSGKFVVTRRELDRESKLLEAETKRADDAIASKDANNEKINDKIIPLMTEVVRILTEVGRVLQLSNSPTTETEKRLSEQMQALIQTIQGMDK